MVCATSKASDQPAHTRRLIRGFDSLLNILALIYIRIAVYTHCQMNENPCSNQEIHMLFEHGSELENT